MDRLTEIYIFFFLLVSVLHSQPSTASTRKTYIVHMKHHIKPSIYPTHQDWYSSTLQSLSIAPSSSSSSSAASLLYTYNTAYPGFAASLNTDEVNSLRLSNSVLGVYEDTIYNLHTTRTPEFLGLSTGEDLTWAGHSTQDLNIASQDVIIGMLDTGIWPESKSFDDTGLPPIPSKWRGECESGHDFKKSVCNRKLIGARSFSQGYKMASGGSFMKEPKEIQSPRDYEGHGTHTASTAAGSFVSNASFLGYASGTARGMAPKARIAAYKVCWKSGCFGSDILAGMDRAIMDGVDVISMSLGGGSGPYYRDTIAIGAFTAVERGIVVSCSAGNSGPSRASLGNTAPWVMTVGAGTLDRDFPAYVVLGNGRRFDGVSLYSGKGMGKRQVSLVYGDERGSGNLCLPGSLNSARVKGKVVLCDRGINARVEKGKVVRDAGGVGMILSNTAENGEELVADAHLLPALAVGMKIGDVIRKYVKSSKKEPTAVLSFAGTVLNVRPSPVVAAFSSRGPNLLTPQLLKPDVIGPGVNILAAWSDAIGPTGMDTDKRRTQFNIMSGTSMSCPHISGLAALLKAAHPDWSASAIKSALMTTAYNHDNTKLPLRDASDGSLSTPWAHGAGHVDPQKAMSPGLVYDATADDYIAFLCSLNYSPQHVRMIVKRHNVTCPKNVSDPGQLNYPSFSVLFGRSRTVKYTRELTNVGAARTLYNVSFDAPSVIGVKVRPTRLLFRRVGEKKKYTVTFLARKGRTPPSSKMAFGSVIWSSARTHVRSPVSFMWS